MPLQNRVTPYGELLAVPDRGLLWGNRGRLLDRHGALARYSTTRAWLICVLEFKGRRRQLWTPGRLTELFFLDEATALGAGHRPCGECRYRDYRAFKAAWLAAHPGDTPRAQALDAHLHADRLAAPGVRRTYRAALGELPDGVLVDLDGRPWLLTRGQLAAWTPGGYTGRRDAEPGLTASVITPRATVAAIAAGYQPVLHPSASD